MTIDLGLQGAAEPVAPVPEQDDTSRLTFDTRHRVLSPETLVADTEPASLQVMKQKLSKKCFAMCLHRCSLSLYNFELVWCQSNLVVRIICKIS